MKYRTYPGTDIRASEVGFGLWTLAAGWWGEFTDEQAVALLHRAHDLGITLFDSGDTYGNGRADELLRKAFGDRRDRITITTKIGYDFYNHPDARRGQQEIPHNADPAFIRMAVEQSLERMGTDVIDIVSFHNTKEEHVPDDAIWETLQRLQDEGKIRAWGGALGPSNGYLFEGLDLVPRSWLINGLQKLEALRWLHEGRGMTIGQAALKWLLASPVVMTTLPNIYNVEQLEEFAAAPDLPDLTADDLAKVAELQRTNFGVHEDHMRYKGTMVREGEPLGPVYRYAGDGFPGAPQVAETAAAD